MLGPLLLTIYCLGLNRVFEHHQLRELYVELPRGQPAYLTTATDRILRCTVDVKTWMSCHNLLLNENKTEAIIISAVNNRNRVQPSVDQVIDVRGCAVTSKPGIRDIGVLLHNTRSMMNQVRRVS